MGGGSRNLDGFLALLAGRQKGVVTRKQILDAGFSRRRIERRLASGALIPIHPGVYLVGHRAGPPLAFEAAAILACARSRGGSADPGYALLSRRTAARLWQLPVPEGGPLQVTVVGHSRRSLEGVEIDCIRAVAPSEVRRHQGLPLTSPALTLLDLAGDGAVDLAATLNEARVLRLVADHELKATLERHPQRRGARVLRRLLSAEHGPTITRSVAERRALAMMKRHGIVPDATDHPIGPYRVDFWFERERLAVEVDGYRYHATPKRFIDDRRRIADLAARDVMVFPITWADLADPAATVRRLAGTLAARRTR